MQRWLLPDDVLDWRSFVKVVVGFNGKAQPFGSMVVTHCRSLESCSDLARARLELSDSLHLINQVHAKPDLQ
jgi:hypothetical protein